MAQIIDIKEQIRRENKIAANWLIHYRECKRDHEEQRQEILAGAREHDENVGGGRLSITGRPVESMACKLNEHDTNTSAKWLPDCRGCKGHCGSKETSIA